MLDAGATAPTFELPDLHGARHAFPAAEPVIIAFFKASCPICQLTLPFLERLARAGMTVYGISQNDAGTAKDFNRQYGITFPTLLDDSGYPVSNAYRITSVPSVFRLDPGGQITWTMEGFQKARLLELDPEVFRANENVPAWKAG